MQRLRDGQWKTEVQQKGDSENHSEMRVLMQAEEIGQDFRSNHTEYL